jgi:hypothetical protein
VHDELICLEGRNKNRVIEGNTGHRQSREKKKRRNFIEAGVWNIGNKEYISNLH